MVTQPNSSRSVVAWRWAVLVLALIQLIAPVAARTFASDFLDTGSTSAQALITPAGYAFSVWLLICVLSAVTAGAVVRYGLGSWWESSVLIDACIVFVGFSAWLVVAGQDWQWVSVVVLATMVGALVQIVRRLVRHRSEPTCPAWVATLATVTFGLYLGWSSIAFFANVSAALIYSGWSATAVAWQFVIVVLAALASVGLTIMLRATPGYVGGVLWAFVAIAIGSAQRGSTVLSVTAMIGTAVVIATAVATWGRLNRRGAVRA